ncbi:Pls/PosA family non-ribosomal peptide synthetase [Streptomyces sp. RFCAC02]|uniref:Pls/PosA family non-ribosomal peptide synthetase n=1 Tax=Streptomyces sp. RFCAC02 TaxID=2499143 RepID=UPI001F0D1815|nr:Pls/PosA family non-ribosomal peptide synthetase [Streptomyces sp. RFCAC02]
MSVDLSAGVPLGRPAAPQYVSGPAAPPRTLLDVFRHSLLHSPDAPALDDGGPGGPLTYRALDTAARRLAGRLRAAGIGPGDRVGVRVASGTAGLYTAILGVLASGAAYVPVDADDPAERARLVWTEARVHAVVHDEDGHPGEHLIRTTPGGTPARRQGPPTPADDAWIIFTSGSTGRPKGVAVTHRAAAAFADAEARLFLPDAPLGPGDRVLAGLSVAFDASCEEMWLAWRHGACLVPAPRSLVRGGADLGPWLAERGITVVSTVPTLALLWPREALAGVRLLILGGEPCPPEVVHRFARDGREVWNTYGPTEATVVACAARLRPGRPVLIGLPLDGWELAVLDPQGRPVAPGGTGELVIGGVGLGRYLDARLDAERFAPLPALGRPRAYRTGDLVRARPEGLEFAGRADDQVKIGGRRVELGELDAALRGLPGVAAALAAVRRTPAGVDILVGYVVPDPGRGSFDRAAALALLRERLPAALVPRLAVLPELPVRTSGKADRAALPWPLPADDAHDPAPDPADAWLLDRWTDVLGTRPGPDDNFFDLGGTSVAAARLVSALRERFPRLSVADLYRNSTPAALRTLLTTPQAPPAAPPPPQRPRTTGRGTRLLQCAAQPLLHTPTGVRWLLTLVLAGNVLAAAGHPGILPTLDWWALAPAWLLLSSLPGRVLLAAGAARVLCHGITPGAHPRAGHRHLRLWAAERLTDTLALTPVTGTPLAIWYARLLGCRVGARVALHALPPVTGLATFGDDCVIEPEADLAGHRLDTDALHVGPLRIGRGARIGARAVLQPGARVGAHADVPPGTCVTGRVPARHAPTATPRPYARRWTLVRLLSPALLTLLTWTAAAPAVLLVLTVPIGGPAALPLRATLLVALGVTAHALALALTVRLLGRLVRPGVHPADSAAGWAAWLTHALLDISRRTLFPLYASLLTPLWFRLLGARIGHDTELSTVHALPSLLRVGDRAFLADNVLAAPYALRPGGRVHLGTARVGDGAFVGNSGIVGPDRGVAPRALIGVLATTPPAVPASSSWLGNPPLPLQRTPEPTDPSRTYAPTTRLRAARAAVELCRTVPVVLDAAIRLTVTYALLLAWEHGGPALAAALCGPVLTAAGLAAATVTTAAKWLLTGRFEPGRHPLWSAFVWRDELYDTFVETLAVPWFVRPALGTPLLTAWLRTLGARVGRRVWCETHWLPEPDLVRLGDDTAVGRGCVLQTHLFHDRVMRLDTVTVDTGGALGPHGIVLPGGRIGAGASAGPASLVMAAEHLPAGTRWQGNPVHPDAR